MSAGSRKTGEPGGLLIGLPRRVVSLKVLLLIIGVLIVTIGITAYVESTVSDLKRNLPMEVMERERDVVLLIQNLIDLEGRIDRKLQDPHNVELAGIEEQLAVVEDQLGLIAARYPLDDFFGAAAVVATLNPVVYDLNIWFSRGLHGLAPNSRVVLTLAGDRVSDAVREVNRLFAESNAVGRGLLREQARRLERFRQSLVVFLGLVSVLAMGLIVFVYRERRAEVMAQSAQRRLRDAIGSIPGGFALFDTSERLVHCNDRFADLYGGKATVVEGATLSRILREAAGAGTMFGARENPEEWIEEQVAAFRNPERRREVQLSDGSWERLAAKKTSDGGLVVITTNISELRHREAELLIIGEELRHKNMLLDAAMDNMVQGLTMFDSELRLIVCNQRFREIYGLSNDVAFPGAPLGAIVRALAANEQLSEVDALRLKQRLTEFMCSREERTELQFLRDGRVISLRHRPMPAGGSVATYDDATTSYVAERQLRQAKEEAELANRAKSDFLANVSHELRTPLNAIIGFSEIIKDELFGSIQNSRYREYALDIHDSGTHLLSLINDILDLSKIEAGKFQLVEQYLNLNGLVTSTSRLIRDRVVEGGISLTLEVASDLPPLFADQRAVKQILLNLLSNAVKFTNPGGRIVVSAALDAENVLYLVVSDTGIGISKEDLAEALAPFGQVDSSLTRRYEGTGLGLPLTRRLVDLHGGTLTIDSEAGEGTIVTVTFPEWRLGKDARSARGDHTIQA